MVVGLDDAVGGAALAGHVAVGKVGLVFAIASSGALFASQIHWCPGHGCPRSSRMTAVNFASCLPLTEFENPVLKGFEDYARLLCALPDAGHRNGIGRNSRAMARTDRRSLPSRSPFWRVV